ANLARVGLFELRDEPEHGGLARARRPEQRGDASCGRLEAHPGGCRGVSLASKALGEVGRRDAHGTRASDGPPSSWGRGTVRSTGVFASRWLDRISTIFLNTKVIRARSVRSDATANAPTKLYSL